MVFRDHFPKDILGLPVETLHGVLGGPALFYFPGLRPEPLFVATLLHGNEHTGFLALRSWLAPYLSGAKPLPRSLWLFLGNLEAAAANERHLPHQPDFNRLWRGHESPEGALAREVMDRVKPATLFAAVDVHNNTGRNPHYACVARWDRPALHLASLFSSAVVHADLPRTTLCHAFSDHCPAVTLECGLSGDESGRIHAERFLDGALHLAHHSDRPLPTGDVRGYTTRARLRVLPHVSFGFGPGDSSRTLWFRADLDYLNFSELPPGTELGRFSGTEVPVVVEDETGRDPGLLRWEGGRIVTKETLTPAMLTLSETAIRQDCVGYFMVPKALP